MVAEQLAKGHAYDKHVVDDAEYPEIDSRSAFADLVEDVMTSPDATKPLPGDRQASWQAKTRTVVILNPKDPDGGTAFRPAQGKAYFDDL